MSKAKTQKVIAKYKGDGYLHGIPAKDLTPDIWQALDEDQQALVKASAIYEMVASSKATKDGE